MEYVLNQEDLWAHAHSAVVANNEEDEDEIDDDLERHLADFDVALFSLIEPLDTSVESLATILDEVLKDSLWKRTLARVEDDERNLEQAVLLSRANWLWRNTTNQQRAAFFFSGLGHKPGLFIHEQLDALVEVLAALHSAVTSNDVDAVAKTAVQFAKLVMPESFFSVSKLPDDWEDVLSD